MSEVARTLVLPDLDPPSADVVRNLAIYWDEVVCPVYRDKGFFDDEDPLALEGVVRELAREIAPESIFPVSEDGVAVDKESWVYVVEPSDEGIPQVKLAPMDVDGQKRSLPLKDRSDDELKMLTAISFVQHLGYIDDALSIAASNNFAPISHSLGGHLATVIGASRGGADAPSREAALLSVVGEAFTIDQSVSSEEILKFRSRGAKAQARLRASLVDLSAQLKAGGSPVAMLAEARDVYRNRVEPALGDLEEVLKESQIKFFTKSLVGATAVAIAPIEPVSTSLGAARVMGQTIDYSYSKSRLVREHPYGYLHQVGQELGAAPKLGHSLEAETIMMSPQESLWNLWFEGWKKGREGQRILASLDKPEASL